MHFFVDNSVKKVHHLSCVDGKRYPAKFIWRLAYEIVAGHRLHPSVDYSGGADTVEFFKKLGFAAEYKGKVILVE